MLPAWCLYSLVVVSTSSLLFGKIIYRNILNKNKKLDFNVNFNKTCFFIIYSRAPLNYQHQPRRSSLQSTGMPVPKPPEFILRPRSHHITPPETARLSCMVKGYPTPSVTWKKNTMVLKDEGRFEIFKDGGEEILEIYDTVEEDAGRYTCVLANEHGKTTSSANIALRGKKNE